MVQLKLNHDQQSFLMNCLIEFKGLLSQESEFNKIKALHDKIDKHSDMTPEDIVFIKGICDILIEKYRQQLNSCDVNPGKYPQEVREHYVSKIVSITDLKSEF